MRASERYGVQSLFPLAGLVDSLAIPYNSNCYGAGLLGRGLHGWRGGSRSSAYGHSSPMKSNEGI